MGTSESRCGGGRQWQPPAHSAQRGRARAAAAAASALAQPLPAGRQGAAGQRSLAAPRRLRQTRRCCTRPAGKDTQTLNSRRAHTNAAATTALAAADGPHWPRQTKSNGKHVYVGRNLLDWQWCCRGSCTLLGRGRLGTRLAGGGAPPRRTGARSAGGPRTAGAGGAADLRVICCGSCRAGGGAGAAAGAWRECRREACTSSTSMSSSAADGGAGGAARASAAAAASRSCAGILLPFCCCCCCACR